ncbi:MAG: sensor histidine kinase [Fluviicola sp.]|nr:sensor histidine kinase [Fluviicola sp.]
MKLLSPPKTEYVDFYDQSKFKLVWNFAVAVMFLMAIVSVSNFSNENYSHIPNVIAIGICLAVLFTLYKTKKYRIISILGTLSIFLLISITFFLQKNVIHYTTPLWMLLNIILAFFILGKKWGIPMLLAHFTVMFFYFSFNLKSNIEGLPPFDQLDILNYIIETAIIGAGLLYILLQYIKTTDYAENQIKRSNEALQEQNDLISTQNREKEMMLKEIHHRVKNNLQIITSILRLQSYEIEDKSHLETFNEAINRVSSISLIHEKMYQSDMLTNFDMEDYFKSLAMNIIASYSSEKEIIIVAKSTLKSVQDKSIVPIALIYNELITNSVKHAFKEVEFPKISVEFSYIDADTYKMTYSDNGRWKEESEDSFGTEMISIMTEQLEGEYEVVKNDSGTTYQFVFKNIDLTSSR